MSDHLGFLSATQRGAQALRRNGRLYGFGLALEGSLSLARLALGLGVGAVLLSAFVRGAGRTEALDVTQVLASGLTEVMSNRVALPLLGLLLSVEALGAVLRVFYLGASVDRLSLALKEEKPPSIGLVASAARS